MLYNILSTGYGRPDSKMGAKTPKTPEKTRGGSRTRAADDRSPMNLRALRRSAGKTQGEVARSAAMTQPQLSRVEARTDHLVSTLRKYVRALGGDVEIVACIDGREVVLRDV